MTAPWLDIVGIGEDGMAGLSPQTRSIVESAEVIVGGDRHHTLSAEVIAERIAWPSPFDAMIDTLRSLKGRRAVVLVTGDPLWYSVGARIARAIDPAEITFHPQLSAFQWAAARMGWSLADCDTLTVHGRADSQIVPHLSPRARLLVLTQDRTTPAALADILTERGFGKSRMTALGALGGKGETRAEGTAEHWSADVPDFHTLAIECIAAPGALWHPRTGGLPDEAFIHDGQITKRDIRAATLAKLAPFPDALLWDIGAGCGSVGIEWMRAARSARAVAVEHKQERRKMIAHNRVTLGTEKLEIVAGKAPDALADLERPDAIFIGGGLTNDGVFEAAWAALRPQGRLVANVVTLESEVRLAQLHAEHGGELVRISVQHAEAVGPYRGWRAAMPVTQWCVVKGVS
jgi:precorrin-6Y C5,15-methyltransferase (decarboxylating)